MRLFRGRVHRETDAALAGMMRRIIVFECTARPSTLLLWQTCWVLGSLTLLRLLLAAVETARLAERIINCLGSELPTRVFQ